MEEARDHPLARPRLAVEEDGRVDIGDLRCSRRRTSGSVASCSRRSTIRSSEVERVVDVLVRCKARWLTIEEMSRKIGMSSRTLRRRLEEKGTTYRALLEEVRRKQAEDLVARTALTVEQIADSLGYAETASFTHAFKRWTGRSPREFRSEHAVD
jgi:AraC-like DNA-binding protein